MARGGASAVKGAPEFLTAKEIDALYDLMETVSSLLNDMGVTWMLIAGSALGAVRQNSILFCDDDLDIAVMEQDYHRVISELPALLKASGAGVFLKRGQTGRGFRPWDKIRPQSCSHLWLDIFVLKKYHSLDEIEKVMGGEIAAKVSDEMTFPLFHYDSRMALSYWPREWLAEDELLPTRPMPFAQLMLPLPSRPVPYLLRSYGNKCFQEYPSNQHHTQWQKEFAARAAAKIPSSVAVPGNTVLPGGVERPVSSSGTGADSPGVGGPDAGSPITSTCYLRLQEHHYLPIMHSRRAKRIASSWCRAELQRYLVTEGFPLALPSSMDLAGEASCCTVSNSVMPILSSGTASPAV